MTGQPLPSATNESYEIKRVQTIAAACVSAFMHQLGARYPPRTRDAWLAEKYSRFLHTDRWRKDAQVIDFHRDPHDHRKSEYVAFTSPFYGPESDFIEGAAKLLQDVELKVDGLTKIFDNSKGLDPLHIAYTEDVAISNTVTEAVAQEFTFDTTTTSETTISGEYAGATLEEKLTEEVHSGFKRDQSREEAESKESTTGVAVEFDCPARAVKEVDILKKHQREQIPVDGLFVVDFGLELKLRHWWNDQAGGVKFRRSGQDVFQVDSVQGLYEMLRGTDTDYPELAGFWEDKNACRPEVRDGIMHLLDYKNRAYTLDVQKIRTIEGVATYSVSDLETPVYDRGTVIDLSEEQNREQYSRAA